MIPPEELWTINRAAWDELAPLYHGRSALPSYGPLAPTEDELRLIDSYAGVKALELGCGSGHSLHYLAERGAAELWGIDLSQVQLAFAARTLEPFKPRVRLLQSPMEVNPGVPLGHFDLVFSVYAIGWTTDLAATLALAAAYLKPGGCLIFSWEHPVYSCLSHEGQDVVLRHPYAEQGREILDRWKRGVRIVQHRRTLGTFVSEVARSGLVVEALVEESPDESLASEEDHDPTRWYSIPRARKMPTTFILKARKPRD